MAKPIKESATAKDTTDAVVAKDASSEAPSIPPGMLAVGTKVRQKVVVIEGEVKGYHLSSDGRTFSYIVEYERDGEKLEHSFTPNQVEESK